MRRPTVAVLDDYAGAARQLVDWGEVEARADLTILPGPLHADNLAECLAPFDILCLTRERTSIPGSLIRSLPRLRAIITTGRRTANLDVVAAETAGIAVVPAPLHNSDGGANDVAELTIGLIISLCRRIAEGHQAIASDRWQGALGRSLRGQTLGLLGFGRVGRTMVPLAKALGMDVAAWSPSLDDARAAQYGARYLPRDSLIACADVLSLHLPTQADTRGAIGNDEFALMKTTAFLINTSRAAMVDEQALIKALLEGGIAGAALDVFSTEPLIADSALRGCPGLLLTPHLGYATYAALREFYEAMIAALCRILPEPSVANDSP